MFVDRAWWQMHQTEVIRDFKGTPITPAAGVPGILKVKFSPQISNSGVAAVGLAHHLGAARIVLLGYDADCGPKGERHWHGDHPAGLGNAGSMPKWPAMFQALALRVKSAEVRNASRHTKLQCFQRQALEEALCDC